MFEKKNLKIKKKCEFYKILMNFLKFKINVKKIRINSIKLQTIKN